ncbi:hypothetical protein ACF1AY_24445 [Streptomyces sp. NPDC014776]|uniref:hypothetical protein n=1 Tax=Streptomyces sp. NPDC014776 TaxID=3364909 RepID=UPI003702D691
MKTTFRGRCGRVLTVGALAGALAAGGATGALAATSPAPTPHHTMAPSPHHTTHNSTHTMAASITVRSTRTTVKAGHKVMFTGRTKGLKVGTTLVLQSTHNGTWKTLNDHTTVKKGNSYRLTASFTTKGTRHLRVAAGKVHSPTVTLKVT